jgi:hypothetical protein
MKRKAPRRLKTEQSNPAYLAWVRSRPCIVDFGYGTCEGRIHAHHAGRKPGVGLKSNDDTAVPLCDKHHREWHGGSGVFRGLNKLARFSVAEHWVFSTRARYEAEQINREVP